MLLEFADAMDLAVANTWFRKGDQKLITFESGGCRTAVDCILVRQTQRKLLKNVTVMQGESSLQQHKLLVGIFQLGKCGYRKRKDVFVSKCKVWKLKNPETQQIFKSRVEKRLADRQVGDVDDVEVVWVV